MRRAVGVIRECLNLGVPEFHIKPLDEERRDRIDPMAAVTVYHNPH
jgi:hypothetical protein